MKKITVLLLLLMAGTYAAAQTLDTVVLVSKAKKFKPGEHILFSFELTDTVDATGKKITMSRSYYFDNKNRTLGSVREYHNPNKPKKGTQVIYSFGANKLASVSIIPPRSKCRNCETKYFYYNDSLTGRQGNDYPDINTASFIQQAHYFLSTVPKDLPWGYFDDEVIVNGRKKKIKRPW